MFNIGLPRRFGIRNRNYSLLKKSFERMGGFRSLGSASLQFSFIAVGRLDAFLEFGLFAWDCAAGLLILKEAGGKTTGKNGKPFDMFSGQILVASNGKIHSQILRGLNK